MHDDFSLSMTICLNDFIGGANQLNGSMVYPGRARTKCRHGLHVMCNKQACQLPLPETFHSFLAFLLEYFIAH
jgi:hypothetical protein